MTRRTVLASWFASIVLLAVFANLSWYNITLTPEAGGQLLQVTGQLVFPIVNALFLLQGSALLACLFFSGLVGRLVSGLVLLVMIWHAVSFILNFEIATVAAKSKLVESTLGVTGESGQSLYIAEAVPTYLWFGYAAIVIVNLGVLTMAVVSKPATNSSPKDLPIDEDTVDLWDEQR